MESPELLLYVVCIIFRAGPSGGVLGQSLAGDRRKIYENSHTLCYTMVLPGRKSDFRAGFRPEAVRPGRPIYGPEALLHKVQSLPCSSATQFHLACEARPLPLALAASAATAAFSVAMAGSSGGGPA